MQVHAGSAPVIRTKTGPVIDTMCRLPVRFILSRKALQTSRFCKTAGAFEVPSEVEIGRFSPWWTWLGGICRRPIVSLFPKLNDYVNDFLDYLRDKSQFFRFDINEQTYVLQVFSDLMRGLLGDYRIIMSSEQNNSGNIRMASQPDVIIQQKNHFWPNRLRSFLWFFQRNKMLTICGGIRKKVWPSGNDPL